MTVLIIYVLLVSLLEVIVCFVGIAVDSIVPSGWNLIIAVSMFFVVLAAMWPVAVFITERWFIRAKSIDLGHSARQPAE